MCSKRATDTRACTSCHTITLGRCNRPFLQTASNRPVCVLTHARTLARTPSHTPLGHPCPTRSSTVPDTDSTLGPSPPWASSRSSGHSQPVSLVPHAGGSCPSRAAKQTLAPCAHRLRSAQCPLSRLRRLQTPPLCAARAASIALTASLSELSSAMPRPERPPPPPPTAATKVIIIASKRALWPLEVTGRRGLCVCGAAAAREGACALWDVVRTSVLCASGRAEAVTRHSGSGRLRYSDATFNIGSEGRNMSS